MFIKQEVEPTLKEKLKYFVFDVVGAAKTCIENKAQNLQNMFIKIL